jgi:catechol 2,3-dioxygenase-like lactoylglutathione lyase family enzyme
MTVLGIDHVQVAAPAGCEDEARAFYGALLGMEELRKPEAIRGRGGCWFRAGAQELHVGVEEQFAPARKAHPGLVVSDLGAIRARLASAGTVFEDDRRIERVDRLFVHDPFGNRLELRQPV